MTDLHLGSLVMEESGEGAPLVMIHGLGGTSNNFEVLLPALADYRVLRPDLPGAGRSAAQPGRPGLQGLTAAVLDLLRAAGVARAHFVGHSMGTLLCQYIAAAAPERVASMALFGAILEPPAAAREGLKARAETARREGMASIADFIAANSVSAASRAANPVIGPAVRECMLRQDPAGYAGHCEALAAAEVADHGAIRCPTLLIAGAEDKVAPVAMAEALRDKIAGARMEVVADVAHWIMLEAPEESKALLGGHLAEHPI